MNLNKMAARVGLAFLVFLTTFCFSTPGFAQEKAGTRTELAIATMKFQPGIKAGVEPDAAQWSDKKLPYLWNDTNQELNSGWFETETAIPAEWKNNRIYLNLHGIQRDAIIWINGQRLGEVTGPDGRVDITSAVIPGKPNRIRLWITRWWEGTANTRENDVIRSMAITGRAKNWGINEDEFRTKIKAGISEGISLEVMPFQAEVGNVVVETSYRNKELKIRLDYLVHQQIPGAKFQVQVTKLDKSYQNLPSAAVPLQDPNPEPGTKYQTVVVPWTNPHLWEIGAPYLYYLNIKLVDEKNNIIDEYPPVRFGFREIWTQGKELILNGHPAKLRLAYFIQSVPQMIFFEGIGFNAMEIQPNYDYWYGGDIDGLFPNKQVMQAGTKEILDAADERGWAVLMPAPSVYHVRDAILKPSAQTNYLRDTKTWFRQLDRQNRPSILMWTPSMNTSENYDPAKVGRKPIYPVPAFYAKTDELIKSIDPTRLVFHHHGGQTGDMEASNLYQNWLPLQEREEYLSAWSKAGEKPWAAVEYGLVALDFFKWVGIPLYTEYSAIYFGDQAYTLEKDEYIRASLDTVAQVQKFAGAAPLKERQAGENYFLEKGYTERVGDWTGYYKVMDLSVRNIHKSWRALGLNGGLFYFLEEGFGIPPNHKHSGSWTFDVAYQEFTSPDESLKEKPTWANPLYDSFRDTMGPLLVFIGGQPAKVTNKDHNFFSGETPQKTVVAIWDGPGKKEIGVNWELVVQNKAIQKGNMSFGLSAGTVEKKPVQFTVPKVKERTEVELKITVLDEKGGVVSKDNLPLAFFPKAKNITGLNSRWAIYDPTGKTTEELAKIGFKATRIKVGDDLKTTQVLVVGYNALSQTTNLPFSADDINRGLRVLCFEQNLEGLEALGFRVQDVIPRYVFPRILEHPVLDGIKAEDLTNWRGESNLLPKTSKGMRAWPWPHNTMQHVGNYGSVASVIIETPHKGAFTPVLECEFDLAYAPLLEWKDGKGKIVFAQLDLTDRTALEPVANLLTCNLIKYLDGESKENQQKQVAFFGSENDAAFVSGLGLRVERYQKETPPQLSAVSQIVVIGSENLAVVKKYQSQLEAYLKEGGVVLVLPQSSGAWQSGNLPYQIGVEPKKLARAIISPADEKDTVLAGIGPQLLHFRTFLELNTFVQTPKESRVLLDGLLLKINDGKGSWILSQVDWRGLQDSSSNNLKRTRWNVRKFYRQLLTNLGAQTQPQLAQQFLSPKHYAPMVDIPLWQTTVSKTEISQESLKVGNKIALPSLATELEVDKWLANQKLQEGIGLEWSLQGLDQNGWFDFTRPPTAKPGKVGYAVTYIYSSLPRKATFALDSDWYFILKVNGKIAVDQSKEGRMPQGPQKGEVMAIIPLEKGWNRLEMKVASGSIGFGFWCQVTDPGDLQTSPSLTLPASQAEPTNLITQANLLPEPTNSSGFSLYTEPLIDKDDPYGYNPY